MAKKFWNKKRKKSLKYSLLYIGSIVLLSVLIYGFRFTGSYLKENLSAFELKEIKISGNHILDRKEILHLCGLQEKKQGLLRIDENKITHRLRQSPYVKKAAAVYSLPSTLRIRLEERQPIAFIYGKGLNLIDDQGVLIPVPRKAIRWNLPLITGVKGPLGALGEKTIAKKALQAVEMLDYLHFIHSPVEQIISEINVGDKNVTLRLIKGGALVRINKKQYQDKLFVLSQYFKHYLNWNRLTVIEYIDLRFKDQLVIKEKKG